MAQVEWFDDLTIGMQFKSPEVHVTEADIKRFGDATPPREPILAVRVEVVV